MSINPHYPLLGIDGCKSGWIGIAFENGKWSYSLAEKIGSFLHLFPTAQAFLVDMPIGLIDQGPDGRACDRLARKCLSPYRHSSIFTPPCRAALYCNLEKASAVNYLHTGKKLSRQSINIIPKIREVDEFLLPLPTDKQRRFEEAHPELIFYGLNGLEALAMSKKTPEGRQTRLDLLIKHFPPLKKLYSRIMDKTLRKQVLADDIIDAMSLAVAAVLRSRSPQQWQRLPSNTIYDSKGLPMQLGYFLSHCVFSPTTTP